VAGSPPAPRGAARPAPPGHVVVVAVTGWVLTQGPPAIAVNPTPGVRSAGWLEWSGSTPKVTVCGVSLVGLTSRRVSPGWALIDDG